MYYIVGLGNPGEQYIKTRHNVGWHVLSYVLEKNNFPDMVPSSKYVGSISEGMLGGKEVTVLFPSTFMNKSGSAVKKLVTAKESIQKCIVVYDDVDLPLGDIKISVGRGSGGHNGVQSIIDALGTKEFVRIRIGIASKGFFGQVKRPKGPALSTHVLGEFKKKEEKILEEVSQKVNTALSLIVSQGVEKAMTECN